MSLELKEKSKVVDSQFFPKVHYPALRSYSRIFRMLAWLSLIIGVFVFFAVVMDGHTEPFPGIVALLFGVFSNVIFQTISELLKVFTDISISAREILIHMTEKDARTDLLSDSDTSEVDSQ